jgi:peptide/nickel transport system permease protein
MSEVETTKSDATATGETSARASLQLGYTLRERPPLWKVFFKRDPIAVGALSVILFITLLALLAPILPLQSPNETHLDQRMMRPFQSDALLGTDHLGRDILSRLIWGARVSLVVGGAAALIASSMGALTGIVAGYFGGKIDLIIMRLIDVMLAFPYILLAIALVAALGPGLFNAMIAIAVVNISFYARNIRGAVLSLREQGYVEASRCAGATNFHIMLRHILPNVVAPLLVLVSMNVGWMIVETAGLSFLGLGAQPPQADWGSMLADGRQFITVAGHVATIPGLMILVFVLALNVLGDSLRDLLDPRLQGR